MVKIKCYSLSKLIKVANQIISQVNFVIEVIQMICIMYDFDNNDNNNNS